MFITIEGIDGSGKSTQAKNIAEWLTSYTGHDTICTFEPGGWEDGKSLREFILNSRNYGPLSELLMFMIDRAEHVEKVITPALSQGHNVICERYNDSTLAYQSGGHSLDIEQVRNIIAACNFPEPDIKILLDISPELAVSRISSRNYNDKFEAEGIELMKKVSDFYRELSLNDPEKFIVIETDNLSERDTMKAIITELEARICAQSK